MFNFFKRKEEEKEELVISQILNDNLGSKFEISNFKDFLEKDFLISFPLDGRNVTSVDTLKAVLRKVNNYPYLFIKRTETIERINENGLVFFYKAWQEVEIIYTNQANLKKEIDYSQIIAVKFNDIFLEKSLIKKEG